MKQLSALFLSALLLTGAGFLSACNQAGTGESQVRQEPMEDEAYYNEEGLLDNRVGEPTNQTTQEGRFQEEGSVEGY